MPGRAEHTPETAPKPLFSGAHKPVGGRAAAFLPTTRREMDALGWDRCDVVIVTGDAYVDHPSFGMAIVGRLLEAHGYRVGIIAQPSPDSPEQFERLGRPRLFFGVTGGNMDSMVNRYTSDRKVRNDDAYTEGGRGGARPDRAVLVYANRCRAAFKGVPIIIGGIEASLRRLAHYDYWSDKVRRSVLFDAKADLLIYGNAERSLVEIARRLDEGESVRDIHDVRGTAFARRGMRDGFVEVDSTTVDASRRIDPPVDPYVDTSSTPGCDAQASAPAESLVVLRRGRTKTPRHLQAIRVPSFDQVKADPVLYAHASRVLHLESNPGNARALIQNHGDRDLWINPPPIPLTTAEMDLLYELPYARIPHPTYVDPIPAYQMIRFSVTIMRGCFGGCTFCSITEHEGRIIQSRSQPSILSEIEKVRDKTPGFTGTISDLGGPTANMYRLACKTGAIEAACRKPSCVYPGICDNLGTDHAPLIKLYRGARKLPGIKKVLVASGLRYDLAVESPAYVKELVEHHVGGYLKIAPEHTETGPLSKMMKPGMGAYDRFSQMFAKYSKQAGKQQFLIPYFIAAHPGTTDEDMVELALWLKRNDFRADQVQTYLPSPMATATAMYHTGKNPLRSLRRAESVVVPKGQKTRTLHKAFLRYHDPNNWALLRSTLRRMGRDDLVGSGPDQLIPTHQPRGWKPNTSGGQRPGGQRPGGSGKGVAGAGGAKRGTFATQRTGSPRPSRGPKRRGPKRR